MDNKKVIAGVAGIAVVGILSYLSYRVVKEINKFDMNFFGENIEESYYQRHPQKKNDA